MRNDVFNKGLDRLRSVYGPNPFDVQRSLLIWRAVEDLTNTEFDKIMDHIIGSFRYAPLPKDFAEAAKVEKYKRTPVSINETPYVVQCNDCQDMGHMFINSDEGLATWVYCHCGEGFVQMEKRSLGLPRWDKSMSMTCNRREFPTSFFKHPDLEFDHKVGVVPDNLMRTILEWNKELRAAEMYWRSRLDERNP